MIVIEKPNPFRVLKLPTDSTNKDIVAQGKELRETAETKGQELLYRTAIEEIITNPITRLEYELFEVPGANYDNSDWERFARVHKRNPIDLSALANEVSPPGILDFNLEALINMLLDGILTVQRADIRIAVENSPFKVGYGLPPMGVRDVIFG
jgi:hypothetical protein